MSAVTDPSSGTGNNHFGSAENQEANLEELGRALRWGGIAPNSGAEGAISDLSLDEVLLLHSAALEPVQVVFGVGIVSIAAGVWTWSTGPVDDARQAFQSALGRAKASIQRQARDAGAVGVLGLDIDIQISPYRATVIATGTAVRSLRDQAGRPLFRITYRSPFLCDLSARDFAVLSSSGWYPLDLVAGASYIRAPQRGIGAALVVGDSKRRAGQLHTNALSGARSGHGGNAESDHTCRGNGPGGREDHR
jgi:uncharacterized protein YbjQ (UPF0145 family)